MHMHVENLEVAKYKMGKVDGDENKLIHGRHKINVSRQEYFQIINKRRSPFIRDSRVANFQGENILCTNLSENLYEWGWAILGICNPWNNVYNGVKVLLLLINFIM